MDFSKVSDASLERFHKHLIQIQDDIEVVETETDGDSALDDLSDDVSQVIAHTLDEVRERDDLDENNIRKDARGGE